MKVMIISPYYPPVSSVAVLRMTSLSNYLVNIGCVVTVMKNNNTHLKEPKTTNIPKGVEIIEVDVPQGERYIKTFIQGSIAYKKKTDEILSKNKYDVVIITGGPFYTFKLTKMIKQKYNTKCILDFRDLWILDSQNEKGMLKIKSIISKLIFYPIEKAAVKYTDKVTTVTKGWKNNMIEFYPRYADKMEVIYNGYDDSLLKNITTDGKLDNNYEDDILGVFGKLSYYSSDYSRLLFQAVQKINDNNNNLKILQVGVCERETKNIMKELQFNETDFSCTGFCNYVEGIKKINKTKILILVDIREQGLGTKIYDYIYLNKPIIYIGAKGTDLANLVSSFQNGFVCETIKEIVENIDYLLSKKITYLTLNDIDKKYARSLQNNNYYSLIKKIVSEQN